MSDGYTLKELVTELRKENKEIRLELANLNALLERTYEQTRKANERVDKLADEMDVIKSWKAYVTGAVALALAVGLPNIITVLAKV